MACALLCSGTALGQTTSTLELGLASMTVDSLDDAPIQLITSGRLILQPTLKRNPKANGKANLNGKAAKSTGYLLGLPTLSSAALRPFDEELGLLNACTLQYDQGQGKPDKAFALAIVNIEVNPAGPRPFTRVALRSGTDLPDTLFLAYASGERKIRGSGTCDPRRAPAPRLALDLHFKPGWNVIRLSPEAGYQSGPPKVLTLDVLKPSDIRDLNGVIR